MAWWSDIPDDGKMFRADGSLNPKSSVVKAEGQLNKLGQLAAYVVAKRIQPIGAKDEMVRRAGFQLVALLNDAGNNTWSTVNDAWAVDHKNKEVPVAGKLVDVFGSILLEKFVAKKTDWFFRYADMREDVLHDTDIVLQAPGLRRASVDISLNTRKKLAEQQTRTVDMFFPLRPNSYPHVWQAVHYMMDYGHEGVDHFVMPAIAEIVRYNLADSRIIQERHDFKKPITDEAVQLFKAMRDATLD
jgi:hypothetical protein